MIAAIGDSFRAEEASSFRGIGFPLIKEESGDCHRGDLIWRDGSQQHIEAFPRLQESLSYIKK